MTRMYHKAIGDLVDCWEKERNRSGPERNTFGAVEQSYNKLSRGEAPHMEEVFKNETLRSLCEEFSAEALNYLSENKTRTEITGILHKTCARIPTFNKQNLMVSAKSLSEVVVSFPLSLSENNKCDVCHDVVAEALLKLKDPDTELEVVELLLKACNSIKNNVKKCQRLVFEYAPIILVNTEKFIENKWCLHYISCL